jgi:glutaredoxin 3
MTVKLYSTSSCPWCAAAKNYLKSKNVSFKEVDVAVNRRAALEMIRKSGQRSVPVLDINGRIVVGFDQPSIDKFLSA